MRISKIKSAFSLFLDILFPPTCLHCKIYLNSQKSEPKSRLICISCLNNIKIIETFTPLSQNTNLASVGFYSDPILKDIIHSLKYDKMIKLGEIAHHLIKKYLESFKLEKLISENTVIMPIPLHPKKQRDRGFNQSEIIAQILGKEINVEVNSGILTRVKKTKPQITMRNNIERVQNIRDSFAIKLIAKDYLKNKQIILVDDVFTSGATTREAIKILKSAGASKFLIFVLAKS